MILWDSLSKLFFFFIILGTIPNLFYSFGYMGHIQRKVHYHIHYAAFILSMIGVVLAGNPLLFLLFWELMSLSSWQLILNEPKKENLEAAKFYFFMTHFGFVFILLFFLIVSHGNLELSFDDIKPLAATFVYPTLLFFLLVLGFLSKAGVVPMHVWLPYAHPAAPSAVSALMSGVMLKIALYAFLRFIHFVPFGIEEGVIVLVLGAISSLVGVLYALSEHDIKALLANHSIENIGIILIGIGMGMIFEVLHLPTLSAFSYIAALFHIFNHMSFKSLLFMGAGGVLYATHTKNIEKYGALIKTMPWTALTFLLAAVSISALPPTNGFLSEWMIFQSLLASSAIEPLALKIAIPFAVFALALTGGLAIACFVKAFGITFLGLARSQNAGHAKEVHPLMLAGMGLMSFVVVGLMLFAPWFIQLFDQALASIHMPSIYHQIIPHSWLHIESVAKNGGVVSPLVLLIGLIGVTGVLWIATRNFPKRVFHTWACGYKTTPRSQYTATGFAGPIRRFFSWLYKPKEHFHKATLYGHTTKFSTSLYELHVTPLFQKSLYEGTKKLVNRISYLVYRLAHFEQSRYAAIIFNLILSVLFGYRIVAHEFSWATLALEAAILAMTVKILIIGERR